MEFIVEFYETNSGRCPIRDFLDKLKESDPEDFAAVLAGLANPETVSITGLPFQKALEMIFSN
jgi:hypothetical protein